MAIDTTPTEYRDSDWHEVAEGAGEFKVETTSDVRYALKATEPAASNIGHSLEGGEKLVLDLPAGISLWVRTNVGIGGAYTVIVTPGQ